MAAWRSHCPRLAVWDDAVTERLVTVDPPHVRLTPRGSAMLETARSPDGVGRSRERRRGD
jgi:hypothetical protein